MFRSFQRKLTGTYLLLIIIIILFAGPSVFIGYKNFHLNTLQKDLIREAYLIADMASYAGADDQQRSYQDICSLAARDSAARITIIDADGKVLADSAYDREKMETHKNRPEVYQALHGQTGVQIRYSDTLKISMLYVAVPFSNGQINGAVRIAMPLVELQQMNQKILSLMLLGFIVSGLGAFLLSMLLARRLSRPLLMLADGIWDIARGNFKKRISYHADDEMGVLVEAFNRMSEHIEKGINEISEVKNRLEALLTNTVNGIMMVDMDGKIIYTNPAAEIMLDIGKDICGRKYIEVISDYDLLATIEKVMRELKPVRKKTVMHVLGGKTIELNVVPILNEEIKSQGVLVVLNDITELKQLEKIRQDFVANVSHELKTPVAAISGFAETLRDDNGENPENVREFSRIIYDESQRLARLINGLLELSRIESDSTAIARQKVDLNQLVADTMELMRNKNEEGGPPLLYTPSRNLPPINSDPDMIAQVMINLLDNAVKYSRGTGEIKVQVEEQADNIRISVADQGIGIPEPEIGRVFERFYRVDKARSRKTGGTGLGLAIVKHLVEKLGGKVWVESEYERGSTFYFTLPK